MLAALPVSISLPVRSVTVTPCMVNSVCMVRVLLTGLGYNETVASLSVSLMAVVVPAACVTVIVTGLATVPERVMVAVRIESVVLGAAIN